MFRNLIFLLVLCLSKCPFSSSMFTFAIVGSQRGWPYGDVNNFSHPVQSPVDIVTSKTTLKMLPEFKFVSHSRSDVETVVTNTGHTVYVFRKSDSTDKPFIMGGPLRSNNYYFEQMHFHWGSSDKWGSEHFIDGESFSIEGHAVHYNSKYKNIEEASKYKDGLCVVTIFAEATYEDNPLIQPLVDILQYIPQAGMSKTMPSSKAFAWFLSTRTVNNYYYAYPGSLTTSPYSENVIFIIFPIPLSLSFEQLRQFRTLHNTESGEYILENKRQLQPLYHRPVVKSCISPITCRLKTNR